MTILDLEILQINHKFHIELLNLQDVVHKLDKVIKLIFMNLELLVDKNNKKKKDKNNIIVLLIIHF